MKDFKIMGLSLIEFKELIETISIKFNVEPNFNHESIQNLINNENVIKQKSLLTECNKQFIACNKKPNLKFYDKKGSKHGKN